MPTQKIEKTNKTLRKRIDLIIKVLIGHIYLKTGIEKSKDIAVDDLLTLFKEEMEKVIGEDEIDYDDAFYDEIEAQNRTRQSQRQELQKLIENK